jgi:hypothetical protein
VDLLKHKIPVMADVDLDCGIVLDETAIEAANALSRTDDCFYGDVMAESSKSPEVRATKGLVFMLVGIRQRWKQVIAYFFTGNTVKDGFLRTTLDHIMDECEKLGLRIHFVTSDGASPNKKMWADYGIVFKKENILNDLSIPHPVNSAQRAGRRLYFINDTVHVYKSIVQGFVNNGKLTLSHETVAQNGLMTNLVDIDHIQVSFF